MAATSASRAGGVPAIVLHGNEDLFRRNGLEAKLRALGLKPVVKEWKNDAGVDMNGAAVVVYISDTLPSRTAANLRADCARGKIPIFGVPHRRSDPMWTRLAEWIATDPVVDVVASYADVRAQERPMATLHALPIPGRRQSAIAESVAETEALAEITLEENAKLRAKVAEMERHVADANAARTRTEEDARRALAIASDEVKTLRDERARLVAQCEAAQREAKAAPGGAGEAASDVAAMVKVRAIVGAWRADVLSADEAIAKVASAATRKGG